MAYTFLGISKIKNMGQLRNKYNHNCRKVEVTNVIPEFINDNDTLIKLPERNGKELNYAEAVRERINELDYYKDHKLKSNQVLAYEVVLAFSRNADIDTDEWENRSVQWLKDTFDVAPDGRSNVLHAICHKDETGNMHIHALVTPVDDMGKFNARFFTNGSHAMRELQTSYAESVKDLGLERGITGSSAKHKHIRKLYAQLNRAIENVPNVLEGETAEQYRERTFEFQQEQLAALEKATYDIDRKYREKRDKDFALIREEREEELEGYILEVEQIKQEIEYGEKRCDEIDEEIIAKETTLDNYEEQIRELSLQLALMQGKIEAIMEQAEKAKKLDCLNEGIQAVKEINPERALAFERKLNEFASYGQERIITQEYELGEHDYEPEEQEFE